MISNLSQCKKAMTTGVCFEIVDHWRTKWIGQKREVTIVKTTGIYSVVYNAPTDKISLANNGKGSFLTWGKACFWNFERGICTQYDTAGHLIIAFRVEEV